ncbi:MAG TPA: ComF family protein, partial [bacterium]|nr:ComF family protein [bacterium]
MKFGKKEFLGRWFAARMVSWASANGVETGGYDCIVSVPMHPVKMRERGFDQSQVIAREIARLSGAAYAAGVIRRKRAGAVQSTLSKRDRLENVRNAFGVVRPEAVKGCRVLLVDDIFTTGATAEECA